jgi:hypothetical protein
MKAGNSAALLIVISAVVMSVAGSRAGAPLPQATDLPWAPFRWFAADVGGRQLEKSVLLIPAELQQVRGPHELQLDLGADGSVLYGGMVQLRPDAEAEFGSTRRVTVSGTIAGHRIAAESVGVILGDGLPLRRGQPPTSVGLLGLTFFEKRVLVLDYPRRRLAILEEGQQVPVALERTAEFLPVTYRDGKLYLPTEIGGVMHRDAFFFDTGAGPFPLVVDPKEWRRLTGRAEDDPANENLLASGWVDMKMAGAPSRMPLRVGPAEMRAPAVYFVRDPPGAVDFGRWPRTTGLLGNGLFDRFTIVVDLPRRRFGMMGG